MHPAGGFEHERRDSPHDEHRDACEYTEIHELTEFRSASTLCDQFAK